MPNILDSLWNSMALFLSALFFHGMALRSIREKSLLGSKLNLQMNLLIMHWAFITAF